MDEWCRIIAVNIKALFSSKVESKPIANIMLILAEIMHITYCSDNKAEGGIK